MGNLGLSELALIAVLALIFIGPKQLPDMARAVGRFLNEFRRMTGDFSSSVSKMKIDLDSPASEKAKNDLNDHEEKMIKTSLETKATDSEEPSANEAENSEKEKRV